MKPILMAVLRTLGVVVQTTVHRVMGWVTLSGLVALLGLIAAWYPRWKEHAEDKKLLRSMPALMAEMRADLLSQDCEFVREFFVVPHRKLSVESRSAKRFRYYETEHPHLIEKVRLFEGRDLVTDVTGECTIPIYQMSEKLVGYLRGGSIPPPGTT